MMNNSCLYDYIGIINRADCIMRIINSIEELMMFNDHCTIRNFNNFLEDKINSVYLEHMSISLKNVVGFSIYMSYLNVLINEQLKLFTTKYGLWVHKKLVIYDTENNIRSYDELSIQTRETISSFLFVQRTKLIEFQNKINQKDITKYLSSVIECKESAVDHGKVNQIQASPSFQNIPGEIWVSGVLYYDNERVCMMLNATKRTLQRYRLKEMLTFTKIGGKYSIKPPMLRCYIKRTDSLNTSKIVRRVIALGISVQ